MKVYHQSGHNYNWNIESYTEDSAGDGIIFSPRDLPIKKIEPITDSIKSKSFFDPQLYLPSDEKGKLSEYPYFPTRLSENFETSDLSSIGSDIAQKCIDFQIKNNFQYLVIPSRYFKDLRQDHFQKIKSDFINPFMETILSKNIQRKKLLSVIVKSIQLSDENQRIELLNFLTSLNKIDGFYIIFDFELNSKQIKNPKNLYDALQFLFELKKNDFEVHVGYTNTEGILYSIANVDSVTIGGYENLRRFKIGRFEEGTSGGKAPNPRLYSGKLLNWVDYVYIEQFKTKLPDLEIFEDSKYKPLLFQPDFNWHFNKPDIYKHYFTIFSRQINNLPTDIGERVVHIRNIIEQANKIYSQIKDNGIFLDDESNNNHLFHWLTAIYDFEKKNKSFF